MKVARRAPRAISAKSPAILAAAVGGRRNSRNCASRTGEEHANTVRIGGEKWRKSAIAG